MIKILNNKKINHNQVPVGYVMFVFGHPKTHKTTELSRWSKKGTEGTLVIDTDNGATYIDDVNRIIVNTINPPMRILLNDKGKPVKGTKGETLTEPIPPEERGVFYQSGEDIGKPMPVYSLSEVLDWLMTEVNKPDFPYDAVVIDTLDIICEIKQDEIAKELKTPFGTAGFGKDYGMLKDSIRGIVKKFTNTLKPKGINFILVSHAKDKVKFEGEGRNVKPTVQLSSTLNAGVANIVSSMAEIIGYVSINKDLGDQVAEITFDNSDEQHIGSRIKALSGKTIEFNYETFIKTIEDYKGE
jgi:hypothetical protein